MKLLRTILIILAILVITDKSAAGVQDMKFCTISTSNGLSNGQINDVYKDSRGFVWFSTSCGLNRYDGFRMKVFQSHQDDPTSLRDNFIYSVQEDYTGKLWISSGEGYSIYDPQTESFDRNMDKWMKEHGMDGIPTRVKIDRQQTLWIYTGKGIYMFHEGKRPFFFSHGKQMPKGWITYMDAAKGGLVVIYDDGTLAFLDGRTHRMSWSNRYIPLSGGGSRQEYSVHADSKGNFWIHTYLHSYVYNSGTRKWSNDIKSFAESNGIKGIASNILLHDVAEDNNGRIWLATDHLGLIMLDLKQHTSHTYTYDPKERLSIHDNTIQSLYFDTDGILWVGTYRNGAAYYDKSTYNIDNLKVGDVNAISVDNNGNYWIGTNDAGIVVYNPITKHQTSYTTSNSALKSNVIVSLLSDEDGSMWIGTYGGGLSHFKNGKFTSYQKSNSGIANDNIWSMLLDKDKDYLWIGTLGSGLQKINKYTGKSITFNSQNSKLASDYVSSLCFDRRGNLVIGHSMDISIMNVKNYRIRNIRGTAKGNKFSSTSVTQIFVDSRGLIWNGTTAGMNVYDPATDWMTLLNMGNNNSNSMVCSVTEDTKGYIWIALGSNTIECVKVSKTNNKWFFDVRKFTSMDGVQTRQYNQRSIFVTRSNDILIGGEDGISIIGNKSQQPDSKRPKVIFAGLSVLGQSIEVGKKYENHIILHQSLEDSRAIELTSGESMFTVQLASSNITRPDKIRFLYRLEGANGGWIMANSPDLTFYNLSSGTYTLQVKAVDINGFESSDVNEMEIVITPPFWRSTSAYFIYLLLVIALLWYLYRNQMRRQESRFEMMRLKNETEKEHELEEMKLRFFTNISHELRTPLTLILSPIETMIKEETDKRKEQILTMVKRNAERLLSLVNQLLEFRRSEMGKLKLNLLDGDIVDYIHNVCKSFTTLNERKINLTFYSNVPSLRIAFDDDKISKIMYNLLSNAFKFTPAGGRVDVDINKVSDTEIIIKVADTGCGIPDNAKPHIFERFYQADNQRNSPLGGSGVGLSLVKDLVDLHSGTISVDDNPGGGTVFIIHLPIRKEENVFEKHEHKEEDSTIESPSTDVKSEKDYTVMIVDDSSDFVEFMTSVLGEQYNVMAALNGKEALNKIEHQRPNLILSDVMMPEMDGNELCRAIKRNPETEDIPFVMLTARMAEEQKIIGMENGADDYITKPFNIDMLNMRIANLIKWSTTKKSSSSGKIEPHIKEIKITSLDKQFIETATKYVEDNLDNSDISVEDMSEKLNMSRVYLYKRMLSLTGFTPSEFIRNIRLRHAEQLLRKSQLNVSEISYKVGFSTPRAFAKYFKEMYGVIPSAYKAEKGE
jgi:signal transduction histidine kinase/ligand-binding sensor domain-containing protein/DNA-binding response OmpR family regulator